MGKKIAYEFTPNNVVREHFNAAAENRYFGNDMEETVRDALTPKRDSLLAYIPIKFEPTKIPNSYNVIIDISYHKRQKYIINAGSKGKKISNKKLEDLKDEREIGTIKEIKPIKYKKTL